MGGICFLFLSFFMLYFPYEYYTIYCDELISFPKSILTDYVGTLSDEKIELVNVALRIALAIG